MKKFMIFSLCCAFVIAACHKKTVPIVSSRTDFPEPPKSTQPVTNLNTPEFIAAGKTLYGGKCNRCHDLQDPGSYNEERWALILKSMIPKARLSSEQANQVTAYVMANAKK
ncbi:MAG TPA: hypothetical protein VIZ28_05215 [Chitinophagaceae bacterium]